MLNFQIKGTPRPQPRPRFTCRGKIARPYTPKDAPILPWRKALADQMNPPATPLMGAYMVSLEFLLPRPVSHLTTKGALRKGAPLQPTRQSDGDLDNLAKPVLDVMTDQGYWLDDSQVTELNVTKAFADPNQEPGVHVCVWVNTDL